MLADLHRFVVIICLIAACTGAVAQEPLYKEGPVTELWYVRTKPGKFEDYMRWLVTERQLELDGFRESGIILGYRVFSVRPRAVDDPDLLIMITYPNMAAFDDLHARTDPVSAAVFGSLEHARIDAVEREQSRIVIGSEIIRELVLRQP